MHNVKISFRTLRKSPVFTIVAVLTLTLGIGANTLIFSLINAAILHVLPYPDSHELVRICRSVKGAGNSCVAMSQTDFAEIQRQSGTIESMGVYYTEIGKTLSSAGTSVIVDNVRASSSLFRALRVTPILGQALTESETGPGANPWMLLSYSFWERHFGSDPSVIGRIVSLNDRTYSIIGVLPPSLILPNGIADVWTPIFNQPAPEESLFVMNCFALGRLRHGVAIRTAQTEMQTIAQRLGDTYPAVKSMGIRALSLQQQVVGSYKTSLLILFGAVGLVLLITCANLASLLLARKAAQQREAAVRAALGASRGRLILESLRDSLVLSFAGALLALIVTAVGLRGIRSLAAAKIPHLEQATLDGWVLAFTFLVSLLTGLLFGLIPAFMASRTALNTSLKQSATRDLVDLGTFHVGKWQSVFSIVQVALALVLLVGAGLLTRSLSRLLRVELGFDHERLLMMKLDLRKIASLDDKTKDLFYQRVLTEIGSIPGIESAALADSLPLSGSLPKSVFNTNMTSPPADKLMQAFQEDMRAGRNVAMQEVTLHYFKTMKVPILAGTDFTEQNADDSRGVVIINRTMAQRFWPQENPVGKQINLNEGQCLCVIVGVVGDARDSQLETALGPEIYRPTTQKHGLLPALIVRTATGSLLMAKSISNRIRNLSPQVGLGEVLTIDDLIAKSILGPRFNLSLLSLFAILALVLAVIGIFGMVTYSMAQRTHEIGIRMAFGARHADILRLMMRQGAMVTIVGLTLGVACAFLVTRFAGSLLFGVTPTDPLTFVSVVILIAIVGNVAAYIPARRALNLEPIQALRYE
jgi:predicted permease